jgi:hypothetical protein
MPHCICSEEVGFGTSADTWCNSLRVFPAHAIGVASSGERSQRKDADLNILEEAGRQLKDAGL